MSSLAPAASGPLPEAHRRGLIGVAYAAMAVFGMVLLIMGSLLPRLRVSLHQAGNLGSLPLLGILIATVIIGPLLDTVGAKPILAAGLLLVAAPLAVLPSLASYGGLAAAALVYGLGGGIINTATNALVSDLSALGRGEARERRAMALNLLGFFFNVGAILAPLLIAFADSPRGVAAILRGLSAVTIVVLAAVLALRFPPPAHPGSKPLDMLRVLANPLVCWIGVILFFESGSENAMFVWAGKLVQSALAVSPGRATAALVALTAAMGLGRLFALGWLRLLGQFKTLWLSCATVAIGLALTAAGGTFALMLAGLAVTGLGFAAIYPTVLGIAGDRFPSDTGTVFGGIITVSLLGGTAGPWLASRLAPGHPRHVLWLPLVAAVGVAAFASLIATRYRRQASA